eukprot:m.727 g.727  ORF g.727 m.727 type:complete len:77 (-) comp273_c0_seq1:112-342(-)
MHASLTPGSLAARQEEWLDLPETVRREAAAVDGARWILDGSGAAAHRVRVDCNWFSGVDERRVNGGQLGVSVPGRP